MTTLIVPTDFTVGSLDALKAFLQRSQHQTFRLVFVHRIAMSSSIQDLLFFKWKEIKAQLVSEDFNQQMDHMQLEFADQVKDQEIYFFHGMFQRTFNRWADSYENPMIFMQEAYPFQFNHAMSLDIQLFTDRYPGLKQQANSKVEVYPFIPAT